MKNRGESLEKSLSSLCGSSAKVKSINLSLLPSFFKAVTNFSICSLERSNRDLLDEGSTFASIDIEPSSPTAIKAGSLTGLWSTVLLIGSRTIRPAKTKPETNARDRSTSCHHLGQ